MRYLQNAYRVSERLSCRLIQFGRTSNQYKQKGKDNRALIARMKELAGSRPRYGARRLHVLLRREGWVINHKKVHRIYKELGLQLYKRRKKKRLSHARVPHELPKRIHQHWSMDFVHDRVDDGKRIRILTVMDLFSRECLAVIADHSMTARKVVGGLEKLKKKGYVPDTITVDNGSEFASRKLDAWAWENKVQLDFIRPGKPIDNAFIESFNGRLRDECLNAQVFNSLEDARMKLEAWRIDYNTKRPHGSLGYLTPHEYAERFRNLATEGKIPNLQVA